MASVLGFQVLVLVISEAVIVSSIQPCPDQFQAFGGSCYLISERSAQLTRAQAEGLCNSLGGYLAEITSQSENDFLTSQLRTPIMYGNVWIGGSDRDSEGTWIWTHSGNPISPYTNWGPRQPDNYRGGEDCLVYRPKMRKWNDLNCEELAGYICEHDVASDTYDSCLDVYIKEAPAVSGVYTIAIGSVQFEVFCEFYDGRGYTFLPQSAANKITDLSVLYNVRDYVLVRILFTNSEQCEVTFSQISPYVQQYPLSLQWNQAAQYQAPINNNLGPYLYVGFLPNEIASMNASVQSGLPPVQGYAAAGTDFTFINCDQNPNSYFAILYNLAENAPLRDEVGNAFMQNWINQANPMPLSRYLPEPFYQQFEMHMGGCGGFQFSDSEVDIVGAAIGLPFVVKRCC